jgi:hypothetical protein
MRRKELIYPHTCLALIVILFLIILPASVSCNDYQPGNTTPANPALNSIPADEALMQFTSAGHVLGFGSQAVYLAGLDHALRVEFADSTPVQPIVEDAGVSQSSAPTLGKVVYNGIWQNIDVIYSSVTGGIAESTYIIHPGADPAAISLAYNAPLSITPKGGLRFSFNSGYMTESAPIAWQEIKGQRFPVDVQFHLQSNNRVGFSLGDHDTNHTIYIDPIYYWHTFCGAGGEMGQAIAVDASGNIYVTGMGSALYTSGPGGEFPRHDFSGGTDILIVKLNSAGAYQWHTFWGSANTDYGEGIVVDTSGNVYVSGESSDAWNGMDNVTPLHDYADGYDITVVSIDSDGYYRWHTFYGADNNDSGYGITVDSSGYIYVTGYSSSTWDGPGPSGQPLQPYSGGITILKLDSNGFYQWHTFYGATTFTSEGKDIAWDTSGYLYITGTSYGAWNGSDNTTPIHDYTGNGDIFILKLSRPGDYQWHTFFGSSNTDLGENIAVDTSGNVYIAGVSFESWNGPAPASTSPINDYSGEQDMVTLGLTSAGEYRWHTFHGSDVNDNAFGIAVDTKNNLYVSGTSYAGWQGDDFQDPQYGFSGNNNIALLMLNSDGAYQWHAFYGSEDSGKEVAIDYAGSAIVTGSCQAAWNGTDDTAPVNGYIPGTANIVVVKTGYLIPSVTTSAATGIGIDSATLNMSYTLEEYSTANVRFAYKKSTGSTWTNTTWVSKAADGTHHEALTGLDSNTQYDFKAQVQYDSSIAEGDTLQFTTDKIIPTVTTNTASNIDNNSATLNLSYTIGDYTPVEVRFSHKESTGATWTDTPWTAKTTDGTHTESITGLNPDTQYDFKAELKYNPEIQGDTIQFTTLRINSVHVDSATNTGTVTFDTDVGSITNLNSQAAVACGSLKGFTFPHGFFSFDIIGIPAGATVTITITLPATMPVGTQYWKCIDGQWVNVTSLLGDNDGDNVLTLTLTDGGLGDADGLADGTISDPGGPATRVTSSIPPAQVASTSLVQLSSSSSVPERIITIPANLSVKYLNVQPQQTRANHPVTIYASITNSGDDSGHYTATLQINGKVEEIKTGTVGSHAAVPLKFEIIEDEPGTYLVDINGQQSYFTIIDKQGSIDTAKILTITGFILGIIGIITISALLLRRRRKGY